VRVGKAPEQPKVASANDEPSGEHAHNEVLGLKLAPLGDAERSRLGLADDVKGVLVVGLGDNAEGSGIRPGDVIVRVASDPVTRPADVVRKVDEAKAAGRKSVLMLVNRDGSEIFVAVSIKTA
jgi:serine protease Do